MASQARPLSDRPTQAPRTQEVAFRPVALPALAAAMKAVRGGRPERTAPRPTR